MVDHELKDDTGIEFQSTTEYTRQYISVSPCDLRVNFHQGRDIDNEAIQGMDLTIQGNKLEGKFTFSYLDGAMLPTAAVQKVTNDAKR